MTKFKKGDHVAEVRTWDRKGTAFVRRAVVHSCGPKVLRLQDAATGEMFKVALQPGADYVVADAPDAELLAYARMIAARFVVEERERLERCIDRNAHDAGYVRLMHRHLAELHEPRVLWYADAVAETVARVAANK